ncbi:MULTISPECIES: hypothetical protein [unclassified Sinorhizobium]|uniref:hypothetical protein n=1 Tax=unclassified Sinorhizobium TaxID=2613772 RepID=UPI00352587B5
MRINFVTATSLFALGFFTTAGAVEINEDGAAAIQENLSSLLPKEGRQAGVVSVKPAGTRYEIVYDLAKLIKQNATEFAINGLKPFSMFVTPQESGLWNIEGNNSFDVSGFFTGADQKRTDFTYSIGSYIYNAVFDPAISYVRSGDFTAKDIRMTSKAEDAEINAGFGAMIYKLSSADSAGLAGRTDFASTGTFSAFSEKIIGPQMPPLDLKADSLDIDANVKGVPGKQIRDLVIFFLDHAQAPQLSKEDEAQLKSMLRTAFPLMTSADETLKLNNLTYTSSLGSGGAKTFSYRLTFDGPATATRIGTAMAARDITMNSAVLPPVYSTFLPQALDMEFSVPDLDFAAFGDEFLKIDFAQTANSEESGKQAAQALFRDGNVVIEFPKISAKSAVYDLEVSGKAQGRYDNDKEFAMDATVVARDFDNTIAAVQQLAKTVPDANQVSLGMMMAKGFAKSQPDGSQRWDISIASDGSITINGQVVKAADEAVPGEDEPEDTAPDDTAPDGQPL